MKSSEIEIDSILQRLKRSNELSAQPVNQAKALMGRQLGVCFLDNMQEAKGHEIIQVLIAPNINPSVAQEFFMSLRSERAIPDRWVTYWLQLAQDADQINTLVVIMQFYAWHCKQSIITNSLDSDRMANAYTQLLPTSRPLFVNAISECVTPSELRPLFSSIMAASVLNHSSPLEERTIVLDTIIRVTWSFCRENQLQSDNLLWHFEAIAFFIESSDSENNFLIHSMAHNWMLQLIDMLATMDGDLTSCFSIVMETVLPRFFHGHRSALSLRPILASALQIAGKCKVSNITIFQVMAMALSTANQSITIGLLEIIDILLERSPTISNRLKAAIPSMFTTIGGHFPKLASKFRAPFAQISERINDNSYLGIKLGDNDEFLHLLGKRIGEVDASKTTVITQNCLLILANTSLSNDNNHVVKAFMKELLRKFPHLGISMLPALLLSIRESIKYAKLALSRLNFLCEAVVHDPNCAQEVWNLIGLSLVNKEKPLSLRLAAIRTYPLLCSNNRRLYRRIIDSLGNLVSERQPEIRLAVATVITQLAKDDQIRDVSDVIGWVQSYLLDEIPSIVHLAILSLHYMILNGELDFDVVIKVIGKKICPLGDSTKILELHHIVIEAIVVLLGSGEINDADSDDEEETGISSQILLAIQTLLDLFSFFAGAKAIESTNRIRSNILKSLSNYSLEALGIEEEGVKAATNSNREVSEQSSTACVVRYMSLSILLRDTLINPEKNIDGVVSVISLIKKVLSYEEEVLGAAIWQKGVKKQANTKKKKSGKASKSAIAALPTSEEILKCQEDDPRASTSIASLLCFNGQDIDLLLDYAGDLANETLSPILRLLSIQGVFHAMARTWSQLSSHAAGSMANNISSIVSHINGWTERYDIADFPFLALAALSVYLPENFDAGDGSDSTVNLSPIVASILDDIEQAYNKHQFSDVDNGNLCLALSGARSLQNGNTKYFTKVLEQFEKKCEDGSASFGIHYGLALMAQFIPTGSDLTHSYISADQRQRHLWMGKIVGCLVNEFHFCLTERIPVLIELVGCLKSISMSPKLSQDIDELGMQTIQSSLVTKGAGVLMSIGICAHSIGNICPDLLNCIFKLLCKLPFASGTEFALSSIMSNKTTAVVIDKFDIECLKNKVKNSVGNSSALYLLAALEQDDEEKAKWLEENIELVGNVCTNDAVSLTPFLGTLPVLACGELSPFSQAALFANASPRTISAVHQMLDKQNTDYSIIVKGLLASMRLPVIKHSDKSSRESSKPLRASKSLRLEGEKLPTPMEDTLLHHLLSLLHEEVSRVKTKEAETDAVLLSRIFQCLEPLSLPGQFATFLSVIIESESSALRISGLKLLFSQFTKRRKAAFEGREFVNISIKVITQETKPLCGEELFFYSGMYDMIRKSSSDLSQKVLLKSWQICLSFASRKSDHECLCKWLQGFRTILSKSNDDSSTTLSPKTINAARRFLVKDVFKDIVETSKCASIDETFDAFTECLLEIPSSVIDECSFFLVESEGPQIECLWRIRCIITLIKNEKVEGSERMLTILKSILVWVSRQVVKGHEQLILQKISFLMASATEHLDESSKSEMILLILEVMLVHGPDAFALNLLGILLNDWADCTENKSLVSISVQRVSGMPNLSLHSISQIQLLVLKEIPTNLKYFLKGMKTQNLVYNRISQVHSAWVKISAPKNGLDVLLSMLNSIRSGESDTYITEVLAARLAISPREVEK